MAKLIWLFSVSSCSIFSLLLLAFSYQHYLNYLNCFEPFKAFKSFKPLKPLTADRYSQNSSKPLRALHYDAAQNVHSKRRVGTNAFLISCEPEGLTMH